MIDKNTKTLNIINDILDFSKIESGKVAIIRVEYQLSTVVNDLMNMIKERAEKKNLGLKLKINPQIRNYLYGDEVRIRQIILNLLTNAVKYTDEGSISLNVDFANRGAQNQIDLILSVQDTGHGIKKQDVNKLFNSFQRLEESRNKNIEGTGLGLSIVGGYVKLMHGKIDVISEYNKGSEFIVTLPQKVMKRDEIGNFDWESVAGFAIKDPEERFLYSNHEENSDFMVSAFVPLTLEEHIAIMHHHGGIGRSQTQSESMEQSEIFNKFHLAPLLFSADFLSTFITESSYKSTTLV